MQQRPQAEILIVEDDEDISSALHEILVGEGYAVSTATNGAAALDRLRGPTTPSLILLDLMMPTMDGYEFRARQLADAAIAAVPVIAITADGQAPRRRELDGVPILPKPLSLLRLLGLVRARVPTEGVWGWSRLFAAAPRS
jgi:CheY-like chemotaxis protein